MQRKREQSGTTVRIGGYWCVRYADWRIEDGVRIRKQGLTYKLTAILEEHQRLKRPPKYVETLQEEFMKTVNASTGRPEMCSTIAQFVDENWLPFHPRARFELDRHNLHVLLDAPAQAALWQQAATRLHDAGSGANAARDRPSSPGDEESDSA